MTALVQPIRRGHVPTVKKRRKEMEKSEEKVLRVIIAGGRYFDDYELLCKAADEILKGYTNIEIVSGHAGGADRLGELYAVEHDLNYVIFPADWDKLGRKAGPIRNSQMLRYAMEQQPMLIAFWDGKSSGTGDTVTKARRLGVESHIIRYGNTAEAE